MRRAVGFAIGVVILLALLIVGLAAVIGALIGEAVLSSILPVIGLVIAVLVAIRLVRGIGRAAVPLSEIIEASARIEAGEVGVQVGERGPADVRALARAFNAMSAGLADTDAQRRRLLSDVSHELRTPLTVIQGNLEAIIDGVYLADEAHLAPILDEARLLARIVDDLRTLASAEAGRLSLERESVELRRLASDLAAGFTAQADAAGVGLTVDAPEAAAIEADPERLRQVLANLVANALRATPAGGSVTIRVRDESDGALVEVTDTGAGIPPGELERVFERFYRSPESRGSGLGLPIAREIVRAHGGTIEARSQPGAGTTMTVRLPRPI
jgi:two-component system sensor histidine kinase BaeS